MKNKILILAILLINPFWGKGQRNLVLDAPESGNQNHIASQSITFASGYAYLSGGGTMTAKVQPIPVPISAASYSNFIDPATRMINTSNPYMVGTTKGSLDVSPLGASSYVIPIDLPEGVNGLKPDISLVYSSLAGPGIAGLGWQISGISSITRTPQNIFQDGQVKGVNLDLYDRYSLDGNRLICTSGAYGYNDSKYRTEQETFSRITAVGFSGYGPQQFKAETKSGEIIEYGYASDALQKLEGNNITYAWYASSISDLFGNKINYYYLNQEGIVYPSAIEYGPNRVSFYYKERTDPIISYFNGVKLQLHYLLDKIEISHNNSILKTYVLNHNYLPSDYYSQSTLNEIIEYGLSGSRLNSTIFAYQVPASAELSVAVPHTSSDISTNSKIYTGDFNGDGKADILAVRQPTNNTMVLYLNNGEGLFTATQTSTAPGGYQIQDIVVNDINGDNKDDAILVCKTSNINYYYWKISDGSSLGVAHSFANNTIDYLGQTSSLDNRASDFDGDGFGDYLYIAKSLNTWGIYSFTKSTINSSFQTNNRSGSISSWGDKVYLGDFNGDGKTDIWVLSSSWLKIYTLTGTSLTQIYFSTEITSNHKLQIGDFNGDGKSDLFVYSNTGGTTWKNYISTGTGFDVYTFPVIGRNLINDRVFACDFNGDGLTDIFSLGYTGSPAVPKQFLFTSKLNGNGFSLVSQYDEGFYLNYDYTLGDFDGNGKTDIMVIYETTGYRLSKTTGSTNHMLLSSISDGLGNLTEISYNKLSCDASLYERGSAVDNFPVLTYQGPLSVVKSVLYNNGVNSSKNYKYQGLKFHVQGKGFLNYEKTSVTDNLTGIVYENQISNNTEWFYPNTVSMIKRHDTDIISTITNTYAYKSYGNTNGNKRFFPYVSNSSEQNPTGQTKTFAFQYDDYGNVTYLQKNFGYRIETLNNTIENISEDYNPWLLGRVTSSTVSYCCSGGSTPKQINRTYSPYSNNIVSETFFPSTSNELLKTFEYYSNGALKKEDNIADGVTRSIQYEYAPDGVGISKITDPLGHETSRTYNNYGWLQTESDYLSNTVNFNYDNFGRLSFQSGPDDRQTTTALNWAAGNGPGNACYNIEKSGLDGSFSRSWFDKLGREIRSDVKGFNGMTGVLKEYYGNGDLHSISEPYYYETQSPSQNTSYTYDSFNRPATITRFTGSNTTFSYNADVITETTGGQTSSKTYYSDGNLAQSADAMGGILTYVYYPDGKIQSVLRDNITVVSMAYDAAGNQSQLTDVSAGTTSYSYSKFGELKTQTTPGASTTFNYNNDGTLLSKVNPEGTTWYYYTSNEQLQSVVPPNGVARTLTYDSRGRLQTFKENIDGSDYQTTFAYDNFGRLFTKTHHSGIVEKNIYDSSNGYLKEIQADDQTMWKVNTTDERMNVTSANYGPGTSRNAAFGYDIYGLPSSSSTGTFQNWSYSFDPVKGNLSSRSNIRQSKSESFLYDDLQRLTDIYKDGVYNHVGYENNGDITSKYDFGSYSYNPSMTVDASPVDYPSDQTINYTSFDKVSSITEDPYSADFVYNSDEQRVKMTVRNNGSTILDRIYFGGSYMKETLTGTEYTYIGGDAYTAPAVIVKQGTTKTPYFLLRDHLGSITNVIDESGNNTEYSFDAWGRQRDPVNWTYYSPGNDPALFAGRGFTGHEHLPWFNLINMNGRLYDPLVGRMLSPDNFVQLPDFSQAFNRYAYCMNNPLRYIDPDGNNWLAFLGKIVFDWLGNVLDNAINKDQSIKQAVKNAPVGVGGGLNYNGSQGLTPYISGIGPRNTFYNAGYNINSGSFGYGLNTGGFTNFIYPKQNHTSAEQITNKSIANAREYLEFTASRSKGRLRVNGILSWIREGEMGKQELARWSALSGSIRLYPIPQGNWTVSNYRSRSEAGFVKDGIGFSVDITPDPRWGRSSLRIHPDGGPTGTAGCIGLSGDADELLEFKEMIREYLKLHKSMPLFVDYDIPLIMLYP